LYEAGGGLNLRIDRFVEPAVDDDPFREPMRANDKLTVSVA
jgi:hypothetical protein